MKTAALVLLMSVIAIPAAHAEGNGTHNGNGNTGLLNGNLNGNNLNSRSASRASARNTANQTYSGYNGIDGSNNNNTTFKERLQAPGIAAPGLTSGANTCAGSWGLGFSGPGFGVSGGNTYTMKQCEARATADQLYRYGLRKTAIQVLYDEHPMVRRAMDIQRTAKRR